MQETSLNDWYCSNLNLTAPEYEFTMRFWISTPEPFVIVNPFMMTEATKNQWIYQLICDIQIIWKLSYINVPRIIVFELFEQWFTLIVFLFLVLILSIWITMKPNNFAFPKNISLYVCGRDPINSVLFVSSPVCPSVWDAFLSGSTKWVFLIFCTRIFCQIF